MAIETPRNGAFLVSEANGSLSRNKGTLKSTGAIVTLVAGLVLGQITVDTATAAADGSNTGNGTMGSVTVGAGALPGAYVVKITKAAANAGDFQVTDPLGRVVGVGTVGVAFSGGGLSFTLADGAADFARGDFITITVAAGSGKFVALDPTATNGASKAAGILFGTTTVPASGDARCTVIDRYAEVASAELNWGSLTDNQIATAKADLLALGIKVRDSV